MNVWRGLFSPLAEGEKGTIYSFRVLRRRGHDLLALPLPPRAAARAMTLYAAQTRFARTGKALLRAALSLRLPVLPRVDLPVASDDPLLAWLHGMTQSREPPLLAILAGNPFSEGRRFIVLTFRAEEPAIVAKVGLAPEARALIEREAAFLESVAPRLPHLPPFRGMQLDQTFAGLALEFIDGQPPAATDTAGMRSVLQAWLDRSSPALLETLAPWQRLGNLEGVRTIGQRVATRPVIPTLFHGDFAPWNVRVQAASKRWTAIDWERGVKAGVPGWDWFHWMIHVSLLVRRHDTETSVRFLDAALQSADFQEYAQAAQITGLENALLAGYLIYLHEFIIPPSWSEPGRPNLKKMIATFRDIFLARL